MVLAFDCAMTPTAARSCPKTTNARAAEAISNSFLMAGPQNEGSILLPPAVANRPDVHSGGLLVETDARLPAVRGQGRARDRHDLHRQAVPIHLNDDEMIR